MRNIELPADMHCGSCEQRVQRAVRALDGVQAVATDLRGQRVTVEFDEERLEESDLHEAVAGAVSHGFLG